MKFIPMTKYNNRTERLLYEQKSRFYFAQQFLCQRIQLRAEAQAQWLWEETHVPKVQGLNAGAVYWMDIKFFTFICCKNCNVCLKKTKK